MGSQQRGDRMIDIDDLEKALEEARGDHIVVDRHQMAAIVATMRAQHAALTSLRRTGKAGR